MPIVRQPAEERRREQAERLASGEDLAEVVRTLLPAVVRLVAQHFHRSLVAHARARMGDGDRHSLADALVAVDDLEVRCEWP